MKLYEINEQIEALLPLGDDYVDVETGEMFTREEFEQLNLQRDEKVEGVCLWIKNLDAEAAAVKAERDNLYQREKGLKNKVERLKKFIGNYLDGEKFSTSKVAVSFRKSKAINIIDESLIPDEFMVETVTKKPDKKALKDVLKSGTEVSGAAIQERRSVIIR